MQEAKAEIIETGLNPPFTISRPQRPSAPFIFNSPHSGRVYPETFLQASRLTPKALRKSEDAHVDELFAGVVELGAVLMQAHFPRAYLDVNREPYELDPALLRGDLPDYANTRSLRVIGGLGTIARIVNEQEEIYREPLSVEAALERINRLYRPYHESLSSLITTARDTYGYACLIDCHSMPSHQGERGGGKPDVVLGDRFGASCAPEVTRLASFILQDLGYKVALNKPYAGGYITEHYGKPAAGVHALQIEISRALYMNEDSFEKLHRFTGLQKDLGLFAKTMIERLPQHFARRRAAE